MEYKVISTVEISAASEIALKTLIETINTFVSNNSGSVKHLIRTVENEPQ